MKGKQQIEAWLMNYHAILMPGHSVLFENGQLDPGEPRMKSCAPDYVRRSHDTTILEQRQSFPHTDDPGNTLHACCL